MNGPFTASVRSSWRVADIARLWHEADRKVPVVRRWPLPPIDDDAHKEQEESARVLVARYIKKVEQELWPVLNLKAEKISGSF